MLKTTKKDTVKNLFILSTSIEEKVKEKTFHLSLLARRAYFERDFTKLKNFSDQLVDVSPHGFHAGLYFKALALSQQGTKETKEAKKIHEFLTASASPQIRAEAYLALGLGELRKNDIYESKKLLTEAYKIAETCGSSPLTMLQIQSARAAILSALGANRHSLSITKSIQPIAFELGRLFPALLGGELNNYAYELSKSGDLSLAHHIIIKCCAMPIAHKFPEWRETAKEVCDLTVKSFNSKFVSRNVEEAKKKLENVINFPIKLRAFHLELSTKRTQGKLLEVFVNNSEESQDRLIALLMSLEQLCIDEKTDYRVSCCMTPEDKTWDFNGYIKSEQLNKLSRLAANVLNFERDNPLPEIKEHIM